MTEPRIGLAEILRQNIRRAHAAGQESADLAQSAIRNPQSAIYLALRRVPSRATEIHAGHLWVTRGLRTVIHRNPPSFTHEDSQGRKATP
jgi:hypothetical protein